MRNKARPPAQQRARVGAAREASPCDRPSPFLGWLVIALPAQSFPGSGSGLFIFLIHLPLPEHTHIWPRAEQKGRECARAPSQEGLEGIALISFYGRALGRSLPHTLDVQTDGGPRTVPRGKEGERENKT